MVVSVFGLLLMVGSKALMVVGKSSYWLADLASQRKVVSQESESVGLSPSMTLCSQLLLWRLSGTGLTPDHELEGPRKEKFIKPRNPSLIPITTEFISVLDSSPNRQPPVNNAKC